MRSRFRPWWWPFGIPYYGWIPLFVPWWWRGRIYGRYPGVKRVPRRRGMFSGRRPRRFPMIRNTRRISSNIESKLIKSANEKKKEEQLTETTNIFTVQSIGDKYNFNGKQRDTIELKRGKTYIFIMCDVPVNKPFLIYTKSSSSTPKFLVDKIGTRVNKERKNSASVAKVYCEKNLNNDGKYGYSVLLFKPTEETPNELRFGNLKNNSIGKMLIN